MNKFDEEYLESVNKYHEFSAMKRKKVTNKVPGYSGILVEHLASLYKETNKERVKYFLKDITSIVSNVSNMKLKNGKFLSTELYFTDLWKDEFDDRGDESCEERLKNQIKLREHHEKVTLGINTYSELTGFAIFCRHFIWWLSELLSTGVTPSQEDITLIYDRFMSYEKPNINKFMRMYW